MNDLLTFWVPVVILFILPITLINSGVISKHWRLWVFFSVFLVSIFLVVGQHRSLESLGISLDNPLIHLSIYVLATVCGFLSIIILAKLLRRKYAKYWYQDWHFLFLFIPISIAQQFIYQVFLLYHLQSSFSILTSIIINGLIFGYMHTIYPRPIFSMTFGIIAGLFFGALYSYFPNFILISLAHMILNFTAVFLSFFTLLDEEGRPKRTKLAL